MAKDPQYIEGIYNYCDRWCERCPLTARCLNYAITTKNLGKFAARDLQNKAFWENLKDIFQLTIDMLIDWAKEQGLELDQQQLKELSALEEEQRRREQADQHELSRAAREYADLVDQWFEQEGALFEHRQEALNTIVELGVGGDEPFEEADQINEAVEVIRWDQQHILAKFLRAITPSNEHGPRSSDAVLPQDADGSVKVALLSIDRSIGAWGKLHAYFPDHTDNMLDILLHLDRLRRRAEAFFPQARSFIRPGFDTLANDRHNPV